jgi:Na+-driven multidrug efflux pump
LKIGLPALLEQVIMRTGMMLYTIIVTSLGDRSFASHGIAMNLQHMSFMTGMSFGTAATTLVGQCLGRVRADLAKLYVKMTQNMSYIIAAIVSIVFFIWGEALTSLYTKDPELARLSANMLKIIAVANPFSCARLVYTSALRGAGDSKYVARITFIGVLLIRPILSLILVFPPFPFRLGLAGIWIAMSSDGLVCYFLGRARFNKGKWADIKV